MSQREGGSFEPSEGRGGNVQHQKPKNSKYNREKNKLSA
jgi:hypothetical protein